VKYIFLGILAIDIYGFYMGDRFLAGAAFSPLLIIAGIWIFDRFDV
jgi:hypothetical protein